VPVLSRPKLFLTFSLVFIVPLLVISLLSFLGNLKFNETLLRADLEREMSVTTNGFDVLLADRETELEELARSPVMRKYVNAEKTSVSQTVTDRPLNSSSPGELPTSGEELSEVRDKVAPLLRGRFYATIAVFSQNKRLLFVAESPHPRADGEIMFRTTDLLPDQIQPDDAVWTTGERRPRCQVVSQPALGKTLRCTAPVLLFPNQRGALVADLKLDSMIAPVAARSELPLVGSGETTPRAIVIVLDDSGSIVYHTNDAHRHQQVDSSMPYFARIANSMVAGRFGTEFYTSSDGDKWLAAYSSLSGTGLSLAVARNYSQLTGTTRRLGWLSIVLAILMGTGASVFLSHYYLRKTQSIDRVAEGVGAIAKGELDHRIDLQSSDALRPLADNLGLMTKQLREQIAREAETRQFQSFVRLSAILTHDLKNAIEALSLTVANMEWHFDNKEFRADAMKSVTGATNNLRALVARLTNPVTTLSGEHKRPRPVDLVPMLRQVISMIAAPASAEHEIKVDLPGSLFALVDIERLNKVVENLIINALEAMEKEKGTLSIAAGTNEDGKPFFSVSDTGAGMSPRFIEEKLFRPFATTKRRGVGLGLYTCREVVVANGGSIVVESQEGVGTTFRVVLPSAAIDKGGEKKQQHY
jgi:signal transduction histidine kinase